MDKKNVFIANADNWLGVYAARALLQSKAYEKVCAGVTSRDSEISRSLEREGVHLCPWDLHRMDTIEKALENVHNVLLIPTQTMEMSKLTMNIMTGMEKMRVDSCLFWSCASVQVDTDVQVSAGDIEKGKLIWKMYKEMEDRFLKSKTPNKLIVRNTLPMQYLFFFSEVIQNRAQLPMATGHGRFAPVNLKDVGLASAHILKKGISPEHRNQVYTFTGIQLVNAQELVDNANKGLNAKITLQDLSLPEFKELLDKLGKVGQITEFERCLILFEHHLIRENKLGFKSGDLQKLLLRDPTTIEYFFEENKDAFRPGSARWMDRLVLSL